MPESFCTNCKHSIKDHSLGTWGCHECNCEVFSRMEREICAECGVDFPDNRIVLESRILCPNCYISSLMGKS